MHVSAAMNSTFSRLLRVVPLVVTAIVVTACSGQVSGSAVVPGAQNVDGSVAEQSPPVPATDQVGSQQHPTEHSAAPGTTSSVPVTIIDPEPPASESTTEPPASKSATEPPTSKPATDGTDHLERGTGVGDRSFRHAVPQHHLPDLRRGDDHRAL